MTLKQAKKWAEYKAYAINNLDWFVVPWNKGYVVISQTQYDRHPDEWEVKYRVNWGSITKKRMKELKTNNKFPL